MAKVTECCKKYVSLYELLFITLKECFKHVLLTENAPQLAAVAARKALTPEYFTIQKYNQLISMRLISNTYCYKKWSKLN